MRDRGFGPSRSRGRGPVVGPRVRRGSVLVLTLLLMVVMIGMLAFAIDLGCLVHARTDLQRTADASALAAAGLLSDQAEAASAALAVAAENGWSSDLSEGDQYHGSDLDPLEVEFGLWDRDAATFTSPPPSNRRANSVRVTLRRTEATRNPLRLFFARVLGNSRADVTASATAWYDRGVCGPFVGIEWLDVRGDATTDSYDSQEGPYNPFRARDRGSICSDGPIDVLGNPIVRGDALAGEDDAVNINGAAVITGHVGNRVTPLNLPPVDASEAAQNNDNDQAPPVWQGQSWRDPILPNGDFSLNAGEVYDLPPGTYYLRNVTINGDSALNICGPTTIYVTGRLLRAGTSDVNNNSGLAANLQILSTGGTIDVTSNTPFYGVIYAPQSRVTLSGDADLFGAVVGQTLKVIGNSVAHYDESLDLAHLQVPPRTMLVD
ncbi:MAG TPA: TadG family pilus assembly protein [Thermoguttaceae bacterium]|nr:TadG family pilus assembly protein [Thermoguttaceae bacterium]